MVKANYSTAMSGQNSHQIPSLSMYKIEIFSDNEQGLITRKCIATHTNL